MVKCSKEQPICNACAHSGSTCHYSGKIIRSPLTRAYLTGVEKRLAGLENLVSQLLPGINIDDVLSSPDSANVNLPAASSATSSASGQLNVARNQDEGQNLEQAPTIPEAVPNSADGFSWQEQNANMDSLTDGMAALSVEPTGVGYLGNFTYNQVANCKQLTRVRFYIRRRFLTMPSRLGWIPSSVS